MSYIIIGGENYYLSLSKLSVFKKESSSWLVLEGDEIESVNEIPSLTGAQDLFSGTSHTTTIIKDLLKAGKKNLLEDVLNIIEDKSNSGVTIFFERGKIDKRLKLFRSVKRLGTVYEYPEYTEREKKNLIKEILKKYQLKIKNDLLIELELKLTPLSSIEIISEIKKLSYLLAYNGRDLIESGDLEVISSHTQSEIWDLFLFSVSNPESAYKLLKNLLWQGVQPIQIIGFLESQLKQILDYFHNPQAINPYIRSKIKILAANFQKNKILKLIKKLIKLDYEIKSGRILADKGLYFFILDINAVKNS